MSKVEDLNLPWNELCKKIIGEVKQKFYINDMAEICKYLNMELADYQI